MIYNFCICKTLYIKTFFRKLDRTDEDYRRLYRVYKAAIKALNLLETEWYLRNKYLNISIIFLFEYLILSFSIDLEVKLKPLPPHAERLLQSSNNNNVKCWSQYF